MLLQKTEDFSVDSIEIKLVQASLLKRSKHAIIFPIRGFALICCENRFFAWALKLLPLESGSEMGFKRSPDPGGLSTMTHRPSSHQDPNVQHSFLRNPLTLLAVALAAIAMPCQAADKSVAVTAIVEHKALDAVRDGVKDELKSAGFDSGKTLKYEFQSAQGNTGTAAQIARKYVGDHPDVIVAIATPSAQAMVAATRDIPVVFSAVTDPVAAKLVKTWDASGTNVTGVSDMSPLDKHVGLIRKIAPNAKRVGVVYSPGEANSVAIIEALKKAMPAAGLTLVEGAAARTI